MHQSCAGSRSGATCPSADPPCKPTQFAQRSSVGSRSTSTVAAVYQQGGGGGLGFGPWHAPGHNLVIQGQCDSQKEVDKGVALLQQAQNVLGKRRPRDRVLAHKHQHDEKRDLVFHDCRHGRVHDAQRALHRAQRRELGWALGGGRWALGATQVRPTYRAAPGGHAPGSLRAAIRVAPRVRRRRPKAEGLRS